MNMKHLIIIGDGMADWHIPSLGGKTILENAYTPYMNKLAKEGCNGVLQTIPTGLPSGSDVANLSILGYNPHEVCDGRGPYEAQGLSINLQADDLILRCNLVSIDNSILKSHSADYITTEEADILIHYLQEYLGNEFVNFYTGKQYRHLLVIKGGHKDVNCTPPHDIISKSLYAYLPQAKEPSAKETARLIQDLILKSQRILKDHPVNKKRMKNGKMPANSIWPWGGGYLPQIKPFNNKFPQVKSGAIISAVDLIRGIGHSIGLQPIEVPGATGNYKTNYKNKVIATLDSLQDNDFVYLHIEASDESGHEGDIFLKQRTIEDLDSQIIGPIYETIKGWNTSVAIAVLPDHATPCECRSHTTDPVPFFIWHRDIIPDTVQKFDETSAYNGMYGTLKGDEFINEFMKE